MSCKELVSDRISWIDSWRGVLIFLVVLGHACGMASHLCSNEINNFFELSRKAIYIFHMPAFFALAGLLSGKRERSIREFIINKFHRLVIPYFLFSVLSVVLFYICFNNFTKTITTATDVYYNNCENANLPAVKQLIGLFYASGWPNGVGLKANSVLWFLPCLFVVEVVAFLLDKVVRSLKLKMIEFVLFFLLACICVRFENWLLPWGLMRLPEAICFFIIGKECIQIEEKRYSFFSLVLLGMVAIFAVCSPNAWVRTVSLRWYLQFFLSALVGVYGSMLLANLISIQYLQRIGACSMSIMMVHKWLLMALVLKINKVRNLFASNIFLAMVAAIVVSFLAIEICVIVNVVLKRFAPFMIGERRMK